MDWFESDASGQLDGSNLVTTVKLLLLINVYG